jgi:hypothetical protein
MLIKTHRNAVFAFVFAIALTLGGFVTSADAQSQALNGQIEGFITDQNGASVPNATVTARNIETGTERQVTTDASGVYRLPLLPLGTYRVTVEAANFKKYVQEGIILTTGRIATVSVSYFKPGTFQPQLPLLRMRPSQIRAKLTLAV